MTDDELIQRALEVLMRRKAGAAPALTVSELVTMFRRSREGGKSMNCLDTRLRGIVAQLGSRDVLSLRPLDWSDYKIWRKEQEIPTGKPGRKYGDKTINLELTWLKIAINWAVAEGRLPYNPIAVIRRTAIKKKHRETAPTEREVGIFLEIADDPRKEAVILCAADGGMRRNEIRLIEWSWLDPDNSCVHIPGWATKSGKPRRAPMTGRMFAALDALPRHLRSPLVFTTPYSKERDGEPFQKSAFSRWFREIADASGVKAAPGEGRVRLHDHRHGCATNAASRGVRIEVISELLGHASLDQTRDYINIPLTDIKEAVARFEAGIAKEQQRRDPQKAPSHDTGDKKDLDAEKVSSESVRSHP